MSISSVYKARAGVGAGIALSALLVVSAAGSAAAATVLTGDEYLQEFTAADGLIEPENGNHSGYDGELCGFSWRAQSVTDMDLHFPDDRGYSVNGFIEQVRPLGDPELPGSGWAEIQHFFLVNTDTLVWRVPIAVDGAVLSAQLNFVFDDDDWTVDQAKYEQYSTWDGYPSSFNRFMGETMGVYPPHDDNKVLPVVWGVDGNGDTTLSVDLGDLEAGTSTIVSVAGKANDGNAGILAGTTYGAKFTLDGTQLVTVCLDPSYGSETLLTGVTGSFDPTVGLAINEGGETTFPVGTVFAFGGDAPEGAVIDPVTGTITWAVPGDHPTGEVVIPVLVKYPDESTDDAHATVLVVKDAAVGPFADQEIVLGDPIEDVMVELNDHLGNSYGDNATVSVTGLPEGVDFHPETGMISGIPANTGVYVVTVTGLTLDGVVLVADQFTITVTEPAVVDPGEEHPAENGSENPTTKPSTPKDSGKLAKTGGPALIGIAAAGATALLAGGAILLRRTKKQ